MLMNLLRVYLATMAITLVSDMLVTARSQYYGISLGKKAALVAILTAAIPIANLIVAYDCLTMMFNRKGRFVYRYMYVHNRIDEIVIIDGDNNEININTDEEGDK